MSVLVLIDADAELAVRDGSLVVLRGGVLIRTLPVETVTEVQLHGRAELTARARNLLLERKIDVAFFSGDGRLRGRLRAPDSRTVERRLLQYTFCLDTARARALAHRLVLGKLQNQHRHLLRRQRYLRHDSLASALTRLRRISEGLVALDPAETEPDVLLGIEGAAADAYFSGFGYAVSNPVFVWRGRNRRPPRDPLNACLSFGYALLQSRVEAAVLATGLDAGLGVLHLPGRSRPSLVLDLMESFRPLVDDLVLTLINRRQLAPEDFGPPPVSAEPGSDTSGDAVWLGEVARAILIREWGRRLQERTPHPTLDEAWSFEGMIRGQAQLLRRVIEGEAEEFRAAELWAP